MESWIIEDRRKICRTCEMLPLCMRAGIPHSWLEERSRCPRGLHPTREEAIAARAWPPGAEPVSGCC